MIGSGLDVWELADLIRSYEGDAETLRRNHPLVSDRHLRRARGYAERFPDEIEWLLEANSRPLGELRALYPFLLRINAMRFLLDAHVSGPSVGGPLRESGHDVRALGQEPALEGLEDEDVLALAAEDGRILVMHNVADFPEILREWASGGRSQDGVILVYGIGHSEFVLILRGIEHLLELRPSREQWIDFPAVVHREFAAHVS